MSIEYKHIFSELVTTSAGAVYTCPADTVVEIKNIEICNLHDDDNNLKIWFVPTGQSRGDAYQRFGRDVPTSEDIVRPASWCMVTGDAIHAECGTTNKISLASFGRVEDIS